MLNSLAINQVSAFRYTSLSIGARLNDGRYFTEGGLLSTTKVKERALQLSLEQRKRNAKGQIALSERQMRIIEHIQSNGRITSGEIQKMFGISRQATHTELKNLMALDIIEQKGTGKSTYYVMK